MLPEVDTLYEKYLIFTDRVAIDHSAEQIAGVMMAQALSIYRTILTESDYEKIVDQIVEMKDRVKRFDLNQGVIQ